MKKIFFIAVIVVFLFPLIVFGADVVPDTAKEQGGVYAYHWTIATNQPASGYSSTAVEMEFCKKYSLTIEVSGTINMTIQVMQNSNNQIIKTIQSADIDQTCGSNKCVTYSIDHLMSSLKLNSTITSGTIVSATLIGN